MKDLAMKTPTMKMIPIAAALIFAGCSAIAQPSTNSVTGAVGQQAEKTFDFQARGDIDEVIWSLWRRTKAFTVVAPTGTPFPLQINVELRGVTIDDALREIGKQAGLRADVMFINGNYVRIAYIGKTGKETQDKLGLIGDRGAAVNATMYTNRVIKFTGEDQGKAREEEKDLANVQGSQKRAEQLAGELAEANKKIAALVDSIDANKGQLESRLTEIKAQTIQAKQEQDRAQGRADQLARELMEAKNAKVRTQVGRALKEQVILTETIAPSVFDFQYKGDLQGAIIALQEIQPQLVILPAAGVVTPVQVQVSLRGTHLADALRSIEEQAGKAAGLVYANQKIRVAYRVQADIGLSAIDESKKFQTGGGARPVLSADGLLQFPFGQYQPEITCAPLRACDIELQAGELVNNVIVGDSVRWLAAPAKTGEGAQAIPHVIIKPVDKGLQTNLVITTNRRTYAITLKSSEMNYVSRAGFYYPRDIVQDWTDQAEVVRRKSEEDDKRKVSDLPLVSADQLNFGYMLKGDEDQAWNPMRVFDDGTRVFIQMPQSMKSNEAPALVLLDKSGNSELVNYRVKDSYYIVDKLFTKAALIVGVGRDQKKIEISKKSKDARFNFFGSN